LKRWAIVGVEVAAQHQLKAGRWDASIRARSSSPSLWGGKQDDGYGSDVSQLRSRFAAISNLPALQGARVSTLNHPLLTFSYGKLRH
jgi:hypothetical protein